MSNINEDILFLLFKELEDDGNALSSCLLVNKNWFNIIIPILWKNPWKYLKKEIDSYSPSINIVKKNKNRILLEVIVSHLSDESRNRLKNQYNVVFATSYQKPLINYISFCKHADFNTIINMINLIFSSNNKHIIINKIINLFINENMKFTHLYIPNQFDYKIHLIPGFEYCFSGLEFFQCDFYNSYQDVLEELARVSKSIKTLNIRLCYSNNNTSMSAIIKLIESQKELNNVCYSSFQRNVLFHKSIEESLVKHVNTIQYMKFDDEPCTKFLSYFVNLISLEINSSDDENTYWKHLEDSSLPHLKFLKAKYIPSKCLAKLIENTKGALSEISIDSLRYNEYGNEELVQSIAQNCPNLKYLTLMLKNNDIIKLEELLINCQYLNGLIIITDKNFDWNKLFEILVESSPIDLFKFKFCSYYNIQVKHLDLFFDKWRNRPPMLLHTIPMFSCHLLNLKEYSALIEKYKAEGTVKKYDDYLYKRTYEEFEWIKKRI
ncbi:hypothetical protein RclHR1_06560002 [Rhizophagus clarus]|uniref:F-box domain-containing protein n=1 Tax=Rhizophagus clarus TaxID=94130 RepID=A0A2Z6RUS5_9GLOM|nr:hypothetical protein RclHR1_06560002 [Rhizophagus clarus]GES93944.1 hypothetical protein GLOIN_2v1878750 [Rhizophagus clarus]